MTKEKLLELWEKQKLEYITKILQQQKQKKIFKLLEKKLEKIGE